MTAPLSWGSESSIADILRPSGVHDEKMSDRSLRAATLSFLPKTDAAAGELRYPLARSRQIRSILRLGRPVGLPRRLSAFPAFVERTAHAPVLRDRAALVPPGDDL